MAHTMSKPDLQNYHRWVLVCVGPHCTDNGEGQALYDLLKQRLAQLQQLIDQPKIMRSRAMCFGVCSGGPLLSVQPDGVWYHAITPDKLDRIIEQHLVNGQPVTEWIFHQGPTCQV